MISNDERQDTWMFHTAAGTPVPVEVTVIDYPSEPGRSRFVSGVRAGGHLMTFEDGRYRCDDGEELTLRCAVDGIAERCRRTH